MLKLCVFLFTFVCLFELNVSPTAKGIWRWGHSLTSHLKNWWSGGSNPRTLVYKASSLSTTPQRSCLLIEFRPFYIVRKYYRSLEPNFGFFCFWFKVSVNCHGHVEMVSPGQVIFGFYFIYMDHESINSVFALFDCFGAILYLSVRCIWALPGVLVTRGIGHLFHGNRGKMLKGLLHGMGK